MLYFEEPARASQNTNLPAGRSVLGKTVPEVSAIRPKAVIETEGTVCPNTDRPRSDRIDVNEKGAHGLGPDGKMWTAGVRAISQSDSRI